MTKEGKNGTLKSYICDGNNLRTSKTVNGTTTEFLYDGTDIIGEKTGAELKTYVRGDKLLSDSDGKYYHYDTHGSVSALTNAQNEVLAQNAYDAYGAGSVSPLSPFGYCGEYTDSETGFVYLRNRYYDPNTGRFVSEDTHWNPVNMICGDSGAGIPDIAAIMQSTNLYAYARNNPITYIDSTGNVSEKAATQRIKKNASNIISAGKKFGVNPSILAATIYAEQVLNVNYTEGVEDFTQAVLGMDCSVGISQVRISTAKKVEDAGYIEKTYQTEMTAYLFTNPFTGNAVYSTDVISRESNVYDKLINDNTNILYAAAYLALIQDKWKGVYPEIDGRTAVLATLYNIGENGTKGPNSNPGTNEFGKFAKKNYYKMQELLGLR